MANRDKYVESAITEALGDGSIRTRNIALESKIIACCFLRKPELQIICSSLTPDDFSDPRYKVFFSYIQKTYEAGKLPDQSVCIAQSQRNPDYDIEPEHYQEGLDAALNGGAECDVEQVCHEVHDLYVVRRILGLAARISASVSDGKNSAELVGQAEETLRKLTGEMSRDRTVMTIDEIVESTKGGIDEIIDPPMDGIPSPWQSLNEYIYGFRPGQMVTIGARPGQGKAQPLYSKVLMADGSFKRMGDLRIGDSLASTDGEKSEVSGVFPQGKKEVLRVTFSDGRSVDCCEDHLWSVGYTGWPEHTVLRTRDIEGLLGKNRYAGKLNIPILSRDGFQSSVEDLPGVLIESIQRTGVIEEMQCISVSHPSMLYITDNYVVTHNTALLIQILNHAAKLGHLVVLFSHEMSALDIWARIFCADVGIKSSDLMHRQLSAQEKSRIQDFIRHAAPRNLLISDRGGRTPLAMRSELARIQARHGPIGMVGVDYIQLMSSPSHASNRTQEVGAISRELKRMSEDFKTRMIDAAQLNRMIDNRPGDDRPKLSDFRESGSLEQDSDICILLNRPSTTKKQKDGIPPPDDEIIIAKQRRGRIGVIPMKYIGEHYKFQELV